MCAFSPSCTSFSTLHIAPPYHTSTGIKGLSPIHMTSLVCSRIYTPQSTSGFKDQITLWCDRVHILHIQFNTSETKYLNWDGHKLYRAVPIHQIQYDERSEMAATDAQIGWGTSIRKAEENSAQNLIMSGRVFDKAF
ncbi:hypothetical protein AG1IA_09736 [Rhizoctonia solani AG-1 IA]|uniref:Uncharacterized protein n=1 Tax=Thanatephorus cucumeris (strain AG1-IA) TaxID=983506 RepID=L8WIQ7_THACA|nr:hypothetical protein AG1IA_09736 [Rhizoctonia solani AG-1 IA]